jgi:DNA-binding PadR family transcriptional regulator
VTDPRSFLPLTPLAYQVLLALADRERHGYGIIREVDDRTDGMVRIRTGTLYTMLQRLLDEQLVRHTDPPSAQGDGSGQRREDERRKYYALTDLGRDVLAAETRRMEALIGHAHRKQVFNRSNKV